MRTAGRSLAYSLFWILPLVVLTACGSDNGPMSLKSGPEGTVMVVGAETSIELHETNFDFRIQHSDTPGVSLGTAAGDSEAARNNESRLFVPASVTKVVTAALVLKELGADHRFQTEIVWDEHAGGIGTDPIVFADGDPQPAKDANLSGSLRPRLQELAQGLKEKGIQRLVGRLRLVANDPRRDQANPPDGLDAVDYVNCYGSRAQAFNYGRNCSAVIIRGVNRAAWYDPAVSIPLTLDLTQGSSRAITVVPQYDDMHSVNGYILRGSWGTGTVPQYSALPVADSKNRYGLLLLKAFREAGIDVSELSLVPTSEAEAAALRSSHPTATARFKVVSSPVSKLIAMMNKPSDNFMADALFRAFAVNGNDRDLRAAAVEIVDRGVQAWMTRAGHPEYANEIKLVDGAGLSRANRVSPRAFLTLLREFSKEPTFPVLWASLAIAGVDGTLAGRMKETAAENFVRGKTGTLRGAYQLVGYIPSKNEYIPFVILSEATPINEGSVRAFQNRIVAKLAAQVKGETEPESANRTGSVTPPSKRHARRARRAARRTARKARASSTKSRISFTPVYK